MTEMFSGLAEVSQDKCCLAGTGRCRKISDYNNAETDWTVTELSLHRSILTDVPPTSRYPRRNVNIAGISLNDCGREFGIFQVRAEFSQVRVSDVTVLLGIWGRCGVRTDKQIIGLKFNTIL